MPLPLAQLSGPITDPVQVFLIIIAIMLVAPLLVERLKMPGLIGLIIAGVIVGPHGLNILERDATIELLGTVGLLFLMFLGGLETSLDDLKGNAKQAISFGLATFGLPMILGTGAMLAIGYEPLAAILVASCFASHTLVALPILSRLGIMRSRVVTITLGGTLITNILALLVLAVVVRATEGELTLGFWLFLIPALTIYTLAVLIGVPILGRWFFRKFGHDENAEFIFVLATLFVVSSIAGQIQVEPIVGAFLAGIALTQLIPQLSPLMNRIQFIGNTLFVPFFLISVGMLVDPLVLLREPQSLLVAGVMIGAELVSKYGAAWGIGKLFRIPANGVMVMFGLSVAQAASTLAAVTVAFNIDLVDELTVNGTIAMILVSCIASPWITARWGRDFQPQESSETEAKSDALWGGRVLVPVANPNTENNLLQLALILVKRGEGTLLPIHVVSDAGEAVPAHALTQQTQLLAAAEQMAHAAVAQVETIGRVDDSVDKGIIRAVAERHASLIICGWKGYSSYRENFLGGVLDNVVRMALVPVLITRFPAPLKNTQRLVLAVAEVETTQEEFEQAIDLAQLLATELKASLEIIQMKPGRSPSRYHDLDLDPDLNLQLMAGSSLVRVSRQLQTGDLLLLTASGRRIGQPVVGRAPEAIARRSPEVSMIIIHYPRLA
ncbi:cation:proton antiporter [Leptolyngbya sp. PCC 6406]|uniref:cation:proton antiporter domain-containing protein n=1 Tax=Leptolyngbya sp. PCC 6406 TaxID=1173264 RepID=UPI001CEC4705|nr:cation:proton antiporter [Leptolyngbya sp. PCC 6406]